ncbi:ATP-binding protein [Thiomicrorhabdus indica]|uniref:ATP-binding protein n=1 Tax=Thiomicrorhabdus indica TaxID=2267253 RepID=UPI00102E0E62|nr:ATP-binding protein [Thiomicrorhabdus indica]
MYSAWQNGGIRYNLLVKDIASVPFWFTSVTEPLKVHYTKRIELLKTEKIEFEYGCMSNEEQTIEEIKEKLKILLASEDYSSDELIELTHRIVAQEKDKVRFSIDAGIIDRLGQELVARQETAVSELVKNSYDADATEVVLTFKNSDDLGGTLIIEDDGDGMTREELVNGFMRISSTDKVHNPLSRNYKRQRAGQKGIGRFSVQRLGKKLTIVTQTDADDFALSLTINWSEYTNDIDLNSISNRLNVIDKVKDKGTVLVIEELRDKWTTASIKRVYRYVSNIIQPFALSDIVNLDGNSDLDPGFKAKFFKQNNFEKPVIVADKEVMVYEHAIAEIEGYIDETGIGIYTVDSEKLGINEIGEIGNDPDDKSKPFTELRYVRFRAFYYIYDSDLIPKMHASSIRKLARKEGGIRLYRNGFRVLPYAEPGDDWLDLDRSVRRRTILPQHSNINFFGFVELKDKENNFNETSSREGLIENEAFRQLRNFVHRTIITGVLAVAANRNVKATSGQKKDDRGNWEKIELRIQNIAKTIEELEKEFDDESPQGKTKRKRRAKKIKEAVEELEVLHKSELTSLIKERSMLRVLSSVGLTVSQFIHEIKHHMDHIRSDVSFLLDKLEGETEVFERVCLLSENFDSFHNYTSYFNDVVSQNLIRDIRPQNMRSVISKFVKTMKLDAQKSNIEMLEPKFNRDWLYTKSMHPSEWSSILFNFYTNSKKAIQRAKSQGQIFIECGEQDDMIYVEFSDNGDGIEAGNEERIFEEFYTTTNVESFELLDQNSEILGTGLGLKITKDIVKGYRGNIYVVSPKMDFSTTVRVEISKATDKELDENGL